MRDLAEAVNDLYLVDRVDRWRETAMYTEDVVVYDDGKCEEVEHVCEVVPDVGVTIFAAALGVKTVGLGNASGLMVATN